MYRHANVTGSHSMYRRWSRPRLVLRSFVSLSDLNHAQRKVCETVTSKLLVQGEAGTGKSTCAIARMIHLEEFNGTPAERMLTLTPPFKGASQLRSAVDSAVDLGCNNFAVHSFHSLAHLLLRELEFEPNSPFNPELLNRDRTGWKNIEMTHFMRKHIYSLPLKQYKPSGDPSSVVAMLLQLFADLQAHGISPDQFMTSAGECVNNTIIRFDC